MSYIGTEPKDIRSFGRTKFDYTASQGQTAFTGADDDGKVLAFTTGQINVYVNGILMDDSDFTTTGTGTVTLASAANLNDVVNIVSFESNIPDNDYVPASGGTFTGNVTNSGNVTVGGTLGVTGATTLSGNTTVGGTFGSTGLITASAGVAIGGTGATNTLDDYEEGEWTAAFSVASGSLTAHTSYKTGLYQKIGNTVFISIHLRSSADSSPSGTVAITGLPFAASSTTKSRFSLGVAPHFGMTGMGGDELLICYITEGNSLINILTQNGNNLTSSVAQRFTSSMEMYIAGHYRVA